MPALQPQTIALLGAGPCGVAALRLAGETLAEFGLRAVEVAPGDELTAAYAAVIVASPDAALPLAAARRTAAPVIRVPVGEGEDFAPLELLTGPGAWPGEGGAGTFATVAIGEAGARNAALLAVAWLALNDARLRAAWEAFRQRQTAQVLAAGWPHKINMQSP